MGEFPRKSDGRRVFTVEFKRGVVQQLTSGAPRRGRPQRGAPSSRRISVTSSPSTSSSSRPSPSRGSSDSLILRHDRRELVHVNATDPPTTAWAAHRLVESFPQETAPTYLLRDRDAIYGNVFVRRVKGLGMSEILIAPRAPWQNPFAERGTASIRRECLDHVIVLNERHLRRLRRGYLAYYNATCPHQSLHNDSPHRREVQTPAGGRIVAIPPVDGLHHPPALPPATGYESGAAPSDEGEGYRGFGWKRWSTAWIYMTIGLFKVSAMTGWMFYRIAKDSWQNCTSLQGERGERSAASLAAFVRLDPELQVADRVALD
jgi:Integrase core domain